MIGAGSGPGWGDAAGVPVREVDAVIGAGVRAERARALGVAAGTMSDIEAGRRALGVAELGVVVRVLGCPARAIVGDDLARVLGLR